MLKIWEPLEEAPIDSYEVLSRYQAASIRGTAGHLLYMLGYEDDEQKTKVLERAFSACQLAHVPIGNHFRKVFINTDEGLRQDYLVTDVGCYLLTINADAAHPAVAQAQFYFFGK